MNEKKLVELAALLDRFADLVDEVGEADFARMYRQHAHALRHDLARKDVAAICATIVASLRVGSRTLADRYIVTADGTPDASRSHEFVVLTGDARARAKRLL